MKVYNTFSNQIENFIPIKEKQVTMYVCGPTVYSYAHIGNFRPAIVFDMIYRYFKYLGYDIKYASNFTDVNDKIVEAAKQEQTTEEKIASKYINAYLEDFKNLNCQEVDYRPKVSETMADIIDFIVDLVKKDYAYEKNGEVYFKVSKIKNYGKFSNQDKENLIAGFRVEIDEVKEDPLDFVLWKKTEEGQVWESPFGKGRPGWHTECVVMIKKVFGKQIDIHGGGGDLVFPHHENEIAQAEAHSNHQLANYWLHSGLINIKGIKMSKSLGNILLTKDLLKKYSANVIRIAILKSHYRLPLNISEELFVESETIVNKIFNALKASNIYINHEKINKKVVDDQIIKHMNNDFNSPNLITYLLDLLKELNHVLRNKQQEIDEIVNKIYTVNNILGLEFSLPIIKKEDKELYKKWERARDNKEYQIADEYRNQLIERGIL